MQMCENVHSKAAPGGNPMRPLTHSLDQTEEGLTMKVTLHLFCTVDGCTRPMKAADLCTGHYTRLQRTGSVGTADLWDRRRKPCTVDGCSTPARAYGLCPTHRSRYERTGSTADYELPKNWKGDDVSYGGSHSRVKATKGLASEHPCSRCGKPAQDWAYDHNDPNERISTGKRPGLAYSTNPEHYQPMCKSCHAIFDGLGFTNVPPSRETAR